MTASKSQTFAKSMESNKTRLIQTEATLPSTMRLYYKYYRITSTERELHSFPSNTSRFGRDPTIRKNNRWSPVGTIADHRMTNNNRIRKKWHMLAVTLSLIFIVHVTVVHGYPEPTPVRVSHSYTKTASNNNTLSSTTSRSSTITTPFLASDAIIMPTSSASSSVTKNSKSMTNTNNNANFYDSSRSVNSVASRKDFSTSSVVTSIDRPFYTKITSNDAVHKPTSYYSGSSSVGKMPTKKPKKSKPSSSKYSKTSTDKSIRGEDEEDDYAYRPPPTTEKSYHPPSHKLSLEPFFNFLTSLATASREVMSKEHQQQQEQPIEHNSNNNNNKYSPSYETINQSIRESAQKSKKSKKGKGKKSSKGRKGSKKDKGSSKRQRVKSEEEEDEEQPSEGPIPIPLPNPIINDSSEDNDDGLTDGVEVDSPGGFHILDVLRTPMMPDYESPPPRAETLMGSDYHEGAVSSDSSTINNDKNTSYSSNPPSGRANMNKGQGYLSFDNYDGQGTNTSGGTNNPRENQRDQVNSFHEPNMELQGQESINHAHVMQSPYGLNSKSSIGDGGLVPSHPYQQQQQHKSNDLSVSSSQSNAQAKSPEFGKVETPDIFGPSLGPEKGDLISKYPTTFVYRPQPSGPPPGSRPFLGQSPAGMLSKPLFSPPPGHGRPPLFRINKLRPNLHSYYDPTYHNYAGVGESLSSSNVYGIRHAYGPPHFRPPHHRPPMPPPRFSNGYGNKPKFMLPMHPQGSHYVGHTFSSSASSNEPITKPYQSSLNSDNFQQDLTGTSGTGDIHNGDSLTGGSEISSSASDNIGQYTDSEIDENPLTTGASDAENSETKKVGIMESFDLFYKDYKILTWAVFFFATSLALLCLLVYLYVNNPPTEVVQARQMFPWDSLLKNPQIIQFLSSIVESRFGRRSDYKADSEYLKPYGHGYGGKSGKQKRKQTRTQQDQVKFLQRRKKLNKMNNKENNSTLTTEGITQSTSKPLSTTHQTILQDNIRIVKF